MTKEARDAEIERICDLAVAEENARLAEGGLGLGDEIDLSSTVLHEGQRYAVVPMVVQQEEPSMIGYLEVEEAPEAIYSEPSNRTARGEEIHQRIKSIRARVNSYPEAVRLDVGYLLEVVDAYQSGRL